MSRATLYRSRKPRFIGPLLARVCAPNPRRVADSERQRILDTFHLPEFVDQPPTEVYAALLGPITAEAFSVLPEPSNDVAPQTVAPETSSALVEQRTTSAARLRGTSLMASIAT